MKIVLYKGEKYIIVPWNTFRVKFNSAPTCRFCSFYNITFTGGCRCTRPELLKCTDAGAYMNRKKYYDVMIKHKDPRK